MKSLDLRIYKLERRQGAVKTWVIVKFPNESEAEALKRNKLIANRYQRIIYVETGVTKCD